jgi:hypothetical protein
MGSTRKLSLRHIILAERGKLWMTSKMNEEPSQKLDPVAQAALAALASAQKSLEDAKAESRKSIKRWKIAVGVFLLGLIPAISFTFAGTITVNTNGGGKVEFGQGITGATACDDNVTITPSARYDTATALFYLDSITVSDIDFDSTTATSCLGKVFKVSVIDGSGTTSEWGSGNSSVSLRVDQTTANSTPTQKSPSTNFAMSTGGGISNSGTVYFEFTGPIAQSMPGNNVSKIIIQTQ